MNAPRPLNAREVTELSQGRFAFEAIRAPFKGLLNAQEAAEALDATWRKNKGTEKRHNVRLIGELLEAGELEGPQWMPAGRETLNYKRKGKEIEAAPRATWRRISRASLFAFCARHWNLPAEDSAQMILNQVRNLPTGLIRKLAAAMVQIADAHDAKLRDASGRI